MAEKRRPEIESTRDPLTGVWSEASISTIAPDASVAFIELLDFASRVTDPYGPLVGQRVLETVGRRLQDRLAPKRVFRYGSEAFLVENLGQRNPADFGDFGYRVRDLLAGPIEGIRHALEARIAVALGGVPRGGPVWAAAVEAGHRAAEYELWFLVDDGVANQIDPWRPWWRAPVPLSARKLLPDHPWILERPFGGQTLTTPGSTWVVGADLVVGPGSVLAVGLAGVRDLIRFNDLPVSKDAVPGLVDGRSRPLEVIAAGTSLRLISSDERDSPIFGKTTSMLRFELADGRTLFVAVDRQREFLIAATARYEWKSDLTWHEFGSAAVIVPATHRLAGDTAACDRLLALIEEAARSQPPDRSGRSVWDWRIDPITRLTFLTEAAHQDARALIEVLIYHGDGHGLHPDSTVGPRVPAEAMRAVAERLRVALDPAIVYRLGMWDGFHIPFREPIDEPSARQMVERIAELVAQPIPGVDEVIGSWIGMVLWRPDARDPRMGVSAYGATYMARYYHENPCVQVLS